MDGNKYQNLQERSASHYKVLACLIHHTGQSRSSLPSLELSAGAIKTVHISIIEQILPTIINLPVAMSKMVKISA